MNREPNPEAPSAVSLAGVGTGEPMEASAAAGTLPAPALVDEREELEALAAAARAEEPGAFDRLARVLSRRMMAFAWRSLQSPSLAEEAVQESLVRIYRFLHTYEERNFLAWCFTITHRVCCDLTKRERRQTRLQVLDVIGEPDMLETIHTRAALEQALAKLPEHLRTTFLLRQQGLRYEDVAKALDIRIGTVRSRLHETRRVLRAALVRSSDGELA